MTDEFEQLKRRARQVLQAEPSDDELAELAEALFDERADPAAQAKAARRVLEIDAARQPGETTWVVLPVGRSDVPGVREIAPGVRVVLYDDSISPVIVFDQHGKARELYCVTDAVCVEQGPDGTFHHVEVDPDDFAKALEVAIPLEDYQRKHGQLRRYAEDFLAETDELMQAARARGLDDETINRMTAPQLREALKEAT